MTTRTKLESVKEAVLFATAYVRYVKEANPRLHHDADGLPSTEESLYVALATLDEVIAEVGKIENKRMCEIKNVSIDPGPFGSTIYSFELHFTGPPSQPPAESEGR